MRRRYCVFIRVDEYRKKEYEAESHADAVAQAEDDDWGDDSWETTVSECYIDEVEELA